MASLLTMTLGQMAMMMKVTLAPVVAIAVGQLHHGARAAHPCAPDVTNQILTFQPGVVAWLVMKLLQRQDPAIQSALLNINKTVNAIGRVLLLVARKAQIPEDDISKAMGTTG